MEKEYYRLKIENGEINIAFFDKGNPIPHTKYKGNLSDEKTRRFLQEAYNRFYDKTIRKFIKSFIEVKPINQKIIKKDSE